MDTGKPTKVSAERTLFSAWQNRRVIVYFLDGSVLEGSLSEIGKYTLVLGADNGQPTIIYKHAIKRLALII